MRKDTEIFLEGQDLEKAGYVMLKRKGRPILFIPPARDAAEMTLDMYLPQTIKALLIVWALRIANRLGIMKGILPPPPPTVPALPEAALPFTRHDLDAGCIGLLLCNPTHGGRRFIALRIGSVPSVVKWSEYPQAFALEQERGVIGRLISINLPGVPSVITTGRTSQSYWFEMPHYEKTNIRSVSDPRAIALLESWMGDGTINPLDVEPLRSIVASHDEPVLNPAELERLASLRIRRATLHGDFAPWNLRQGADGLVAIDWERGQEAGFAGLDLCYGLLQEALLVKKLSENQAMRSVQFALGSSPCNEYVQRAGWIDAIDVLVKLGLRYRDAFEGGEGGFRC